MNWEMLTAIGQLAAVFIGIPSLIYLALQIRAQTKERHQSVVNALTVQWGDLTKSFHDNAEFCATEIDISINDPLNVTYADQCL
jgi:hypothetical protein